MQIPNFDEKRDFEMNNNASAEWFEWLVNQMNCSLLLRCQLLDTMYTFYSELVHLLLNLVTPLHAYCRAILTNTLPTCTVWRCRVKMLSITYFPIEVPYVFLLDKRIRVVLTCTIVAGVHLNFVCLARYLLCADVCPDSSLKKVATSYQCRNVHCTDGHLSGLETLSHGK